MENPNSEKVFAFVRELTELTRKHGISIGGCRCCGSPWLRDDFDHSKAKAGYSLEDGDCLNWIDPDDSRNWNEYNGHIIR